MTHIMTEQDYIDPDRLRRLKKAERDIFQQFASMLVHRLDDDDIYKTFKRLLDAMNATDKAWRKHIRDAYRADLSQEQIDALPVVFD